MTASYPPMPYFNQTGAGVDASGQVVSDLPCRKCGYNLRGLNTTGRCPECGTAVGFSVQGDLLRFCEPTWVDTLKNGLNLIIAGIVVIILGVITAIFLGLSGMEAAQIVQTGIIVVGSILMTIGWWLLTQPDPSGLGEDRYGTSRKVIRVTLIIGVLNQMLGLVIEGRAIPPELMQPLTILSGVLGLAGVVALFAQLQYLKKLALRIPDHAMSNRANFLMWAIGCGYGAIVLFGILMAVALSAAGPSPGGGFAALGCIVGIIGIALLVFFIMYLFLLDRMRRAFTEQSRFARTTWAAMAAGG